MGSGEVLYAREYFLAVAGMALARTCLTSPQAARPRVDDVRRIVEHFDEFPQSLELTMHEYDVEPGYTPWAPHYDGPNPAVEVEQPVVREILAGFARGTALDATCGTGRHAAFLASLRHDVIGVYTTDAMLDVARAKVPAADFRKVGSKHCRSTTRTSTPSCARSRSRTWPTCDPCSTSSPGCCDPAAGSSRPTCTP